ncbi:MAG: hypothetical protein JGK24_14220 [Microcoleus sp. PH2017_29_MFU_D_A]|uniref:hypothetical protein n=1 Tax=unclassified Microcoleus TaxID=2642155 RepID=UPI001D9A6EB1|nr:MULTISPECIES: hypothetical protein [unclassified Microcoleus]MCC3419607.1 hypothetical protein [Microcoleus sp. PH2017_07_MST_O_A]MCC3430935.1 hypothetical protein [Microcoleus sp. PH2017_04_SCI_O_A]MCC3466110.1 hypothetical protein [Microcoleus sp. PH2017_06_SFM_O_A]MCC3505158.1 hypothetical protein [Microcoleus sp. PH2017_19_SFW_U_A]MCC3511857.1 hypothetical protein [Microcoleus sp. PH2017_17_BER_D_A]TAG62623.1 MAG: hypothetical protein EAZ25_26970 [Oscillatoriales cyanobacterium]
MIEIALNRNRWQFLQPAQAGFVCLGAISIARIRSPASDRPDSIARFRSPGFDRPDSIARIRSPGFDRPSDPAVNPR